MNSGRNTLNTGVPNVEVRGAGIFGLSVAYACARKADHVRLVEKRSIGEGTSGGPVGSLSPHSPDNWNPKKQFQFESLAMAEEWWSRLASLSGIDPGFRRTGRLQPVPSERALELARRRGEHAARNWKGKADWRLERADSGPWTPTTKTGWVVRDTLSARINPRKAVECLVAALRTLGCEIIQGTCPNPEGDALVLATGHEGLVELGREFGCAFGSGEKGQALALRFDAEGMPQIYGDNLHIVPHADGTVAVGSTSERHFDSPTETDHQLDELHARAVQLLPALSGVPVVWRWAGVRPRSSTRAPVLGPHPTRAGVYIANGGFKTGFGVAPLVGEVMADLVLEGRDRIPEPLSISAAMGFE